MAFDNNMQKKCGFCGESIPANTGRCPYCGSILEVTFDNNYGMNFDGAKQENTDQAQPGGDTEESINTDIQNTTDQQGNPPMSEHKAPGNVPASQLAFRSRIQNDESQYSSGGYGYVPENRYGNETRNPLSNGLKVFLTVLFTLIPGIGQLAGIITAIVFMNAEGDSDRKSFGVAILVASLIMFVLSCIGCFIMVIAISSSNQFTY